MEEIKDLLLTTGHGMHPAGRRKPDVSHRHYQVLALHLAGKKHQEISEITGYGPIAISRILNSDDVLRMRQQLLQVYEMEFELEMPAVLDLIRAKMDSEDEQVQLRAIDMYLKVFGKYKTKEQGKAGMNITAEDVVLNILNQGPQ